MTEYKVENEITEADKNTFKLCGLLHKAAMLYKRQNIKTVKEDLCVFIVKIIHISCSFVSDEVFFCWMCNESIERLVDTWDMGVIKQKRCCVCNSYICDKCDTETENWCPCGFSATTFKAAAQKLLLHIES